MPFSQKFKMVSAAEFGMAFTKVYHRISILKEKSSRKHTERQTRSLRKQGGKTKPTAEGWLREGILAEPNRVANCKTCA
jgi:hypothetical protein